MFCFNCGKELPKGVKFCPFCGTKMSVLYPASEPEPAPDSEFTWKPPVSDMEPHREKCLPKLSKLPAGWRKLLLLGLAGIVLAGIALFLYNSLNTDYYQEAAYGELDKDQLLSAGCEDSLETNMREYAPEAGEYVDAMDESQIKEESEAMDEALTREDTAPMDRQPNFLSPLDYWGVDMDDVYAADSEEGMRWMILAFEGSLDSSFVAEYLDILEREYEFTFQRDDGLNFGTYTGMAEVEPLPSERSHMHVNVYERTPVNGSGPWSTVKLIWSDDLEMEDGGFYAEGVPPVFVKPPEPVETQELAAPSIPDVEPVYNESMKPATVPESTEAPVSDGLTVPSFAAFTNGCAVEQEKREFDTSTEYYYQWNYEEKAWSEYIELLKAYGFTVQDEDHYEDDSDRYMFDYTGQERVRSFEPDWNDLENGGVLYVRDIHFSHRGAEFTIRFSNDLSYADTGERTTCKLTPYGDGSSSGGSSSSVGEKDCISCGGSGSCRGCGGSGRVMKWLSGTREYVQVNCTDCYSPGKCRDCGGDGRK